MAQDTCAVTHVMVDLETLGTRSGSAIASVGACVFNPFSGDIGETFEQRIDLQTCLNAGLKFEAGTVEWWMSQSDEARAATFKGERHSLQNALISFRDWLEIAQITRASQDVLIWGHGASFDPVILSGAYDACSLPAPWKFWNVRDTRTLYDLAGLSPADFRYLQDVHHSALSDAIVQARAAIAAYRILGLTHAAEAA